MMMTIILTLWLLLLTFMMMNHDDDNDVDDNDHPDPMIVIVDDGVNAIGWECYNDDDNDADPAIGGYNDVDNHGDDEPWWWWIGHRGPRQSPDLTEAPVWYTIPPHHIM